jgi:hypothetical protein
MIKTSITDGSGTGVQATVTSRGQLVVSPLDFSTAYNATAGTANVAASFFGPISSKRFIITGISLYANQNVSNTVDAVVDIYESDSATSTTISQSVFQTNMTRKDRLSLTGLNLIVTEGVWLNLKTSDDDVYGTVFGYYIDA